jgi:hypothetical protein
MLTERPKNYINIIPTPKKNGKWYANQKKTNP